MSEKILERCPCCGDASDYDTDEEIDGWFSFCMNRSCGCRSGIFPTKPMARNAWNTRTSSPAQETVTTEPMSPAMIALNSEPYNRGYIDGWATAHEPAPCGHSRANWKDPKFGTPEYRGEEKCEICAALTILAPPQPGREDSELEELVAQAIWEECCPGMRWGQIDHLIYCRMAGAAIARMRALTGEHK